MIDICIPVHNNMRCLRVMAEGVRKFGGNCRVLLHVQGQNEEADAVAAFISVGIDATVVSRGKPGATMADYMDEMFRHATSEWVVFLEQDTFLFCPLNDAISNMVNNGYVAAGPVDTFMYDHPNARETAKYGQYARLSPSPGYLHSSFVCLRRDAFSNAPFSVPSGFEFHGRGFLGAEPYYGIRMEVQDPRRMILLRQFHSEFGFAADITHPTGTLLAIHLYYSGTKEGYLKEGFLTESDHNWLCDEENRFLRYYVQFLENLNEH